MLVLGLGLILDLFYVQVFDSRLSQFCDQFFKVSRSWVGLFCIYVSNYTWLSLMFGFHGIDN